MVFCFNDTATTEIYTYRHTRSLRDALPIFLVRHGIAQRLVAHGDGVGHVVEGGGKLADLGGQIFGVDDASAEIACRIGGYAPTNAMQRRSEEHTSELQSLMPISYTVFSTQKKTYSAYTHSFTAPYPK